MEVTFKGIKNLQIAKSRQTKRGIGLYPAINGEIKLGEIATREYKVRMDLINDSAGNHYDEFASAMSKANKGLNFNYLGNPNKIELHVIKNNVLDDDIVKNYSYSIINVNGENINLTHRAGLNLYTYLAKLTRELKEIFNMSEEQIKIVDKIHSSIHNEAVRFIDIM